MKKLTSRLEDLQPGEWFNLKWKDESTARRAECALVGKRGGGGQGAFGFSDSSHWILCGCDGSGCFRVSVY